MVSRIARGVVRTYASASTSAPLRSKRLEKINSFLDDFGPGLLGPAPPAPPPEDQSGILASEDGWQIQSPGDPVEVYTDSDFSSMSPTRTDWTQPNVQIPPRFDWRTRSGVRSKGAQPASTPSTNPQLTTVTFKKGTPREEDVYAAEREAFEKEMALPLPLLNHRARFPRRTTPAMHNVTPEDELYDQVSHYGLKFQQLLDIEQSNDKAELLERLKRPPQWLRSQGYMVSDLHARWLEVNTFGRPVAAFTLGPGAALPPENRFENGTQVILSQASDMPPNHGSQEWIMGTVVLRSNTQIRVSFSEKFDHFPGLYRLDVGRSDLIHTRMMHALQCLHQDPLAIERHPVNVEHLDSEGNVRDHNHQRKELILQGTHLRDVLLNSYQSSTERHEALQSTTDMSYPSHEVLDHSSRLPTTTKPWGACCDPVKADVDDRRCSAFAEDMRIQSWARRYQLPNPVRIEGDPDITGLNETQTRAMAMMIGERISLVQGPPGTGKTKTIIETIKLLKLHFQVAQPLLVCTFTNVAVDNLVEGLAAVGVRPLRVASNNKSSKASLNKYTLDYKLERHPLQAELGETMRREYAQQCRIDPLVAEEKRLIELATSRELDSKEKQKLMRVQTSKVFAERSMSHLRAKMYSLRQEMFQDILGDTDVICTTCITSACVALNVVDFPVVFLDEASMSTEPASLIPLMKGSQHVALIGDHKQLSPVITSPEALALGLGVSLFERLTKEGVVPSIMLDIQYRMHPSISHFPSKEFYEHTLQDGTIDSTGHVAAQLAPPQSKHLKPNNKTGQLPSVAFLNHAGSEMMHDRSRVNLSEANIICDLVQDLLLQNPTLRGQDIGIIAPYAAQISLLTRIFNTDPKYRKQFLLNLDEVRMQELSDIEIRTVDGFEGREKEIIIFSTVRNNPGGYIGFLADRRRLNVGLTRAKRALFVIGSLDTLKQSRKDKNIPATHALVRSGESADVWRRYTEFLTQEGLVVQLKGNATRSMLTGVATLEDMGRGDLGIPENVSVRDAYEAYFENGGALATVVRQTPVRQVSPTYSQDHSRSSPPPHPKSSPGADKVYYAQFADVTW